jgi:hypothetical protein
MRLAAPAVLLCAVLLYWSICPVLGENRSWRSDTLRRGVEAHRRGEFAVAELVYIELLQYDPFDVDALKSACCLFL